jgi:hypothetical protein
MLAYINKKRYEKHVSQIGDVNWGRNLAGGRADAKAVRAEECEITARETSPDGAVASQVVSAISQMREDAAAREAKMLEQQTMLYQALMTTVNPNIDVANVLAPKPLPPPTAEAAPTSRPEPSNALVVPIARSKLKHAREFQEDVTYLSHFTDLGKALDYARTELYPRECKEGASWRILQREDGREDKSRDKQWRNYRALAIAVGIERQKGASYVDAVRTIQVRFDGFGAKAHTPFLKSINDDIKRRDADLIVREIFQCIPHTERVSASGVALSGA